MTLKQYERQTRVGQVAQLKQEQDGRVVADARSTPTSQASSQATSRSPSGQPVGKPLGKLVTVTSADQLTVGMHLRLRDQGLSGLVEVVRVYPKHYKSLDETEASAYVEGVNSHAWSGLYFDEHLKQYKAVIVT